MLAPTAPLLAQKCLARALHHIGKTNTEVHRTTLVTTSKPIGLVYPRARRAQWMMLSQAVPSLVDVLVDRLLQDFLGWFPQRCDSDRPCFRGVQ